MEVKSYKLENDNYYNEIDQVYYNDIKYMLLANENDINDICIRKMIIIDNDEYISTIEEKEFNKVREILIDKNKGLLV